MILACCLFCGPLAHSLKPWLCCMCWLSSEVKMSLQIGTPQYDTEYNAVKYYGNANSTTARNSYQQETPYFWADDVSKRITLLVHCCL